MSFCFSITLLSQTREHVTRPKIGLVLSGGGAKGLAHIGVLKVLEEAGIRPDYITGTSMGSIVGGLYAIGYSPKELDSIVRAVNWETLLSDVVPLSVVMPEEKKDYSRFNVELDFGKGGLKTPSGFIQGDFIYDLFSRLSLRVADIKSFDDYPIPFRCVAADLLTGKQYVFKDGNFATALRASMSIPTAFAPVKHDNAILVDGGVLENFPVKLCKEMGADIIIGVNVGSSNMLKPEDLKMPFDILMSVATLPSYVSTLESAPQVDILITPDLGNYSMVSFNEAAQIIDLGETAGRKSFDEINKLAQHLDSVSPQHIRAASPQPVKIKISQIRVNDLESVSYRFLLGNLKIDVGDVIAPEELKKGVDRLLGTRYFSSVTYQLTPLQEGYLLSINAVESEKSRFKFSVHYDNEYKAGLITNLTLRNIVSRGNRLSATLDISEDPMFNTSIINYFGDNQRMASRIELTCENNNIPYFLNGESLSGKLTHNYIGLSGGFMFSIGTRWELNAYLMYESSVLSKKSGYGEISELGISRFGDKFFTANFTALRNSYNRRFFPTHGSTVDLSYKLYMNIDDIYEGQDEAYGYVSPLITNGNAPSFSVLGGYEQVLKFSDRIVLTLGTKGGFDSRELPLPGMHFLGGMPFTNRTNDISFIGLLPREKQVDDFVMARIKSQLRVMKKLHSTAIVNMAYSISNEKNSANPYLLKSEEKLWGYGLMLEYDSFLGPVQAGFGSNSDNDRLRWYLGLGFSF